jgi:GrpB-like predicted nucleotidyltransferase (UPF0157 family)
MADEKAPRDLGGVVLATADPGWPRHFGEERARLASVLGALAGELQHFGSTAVPGLDAKPVIDMMAPVAGLDEAEAFCAPLGAAGYAMIDVGFARRRFFRREPDGAASACHLHLVVCRDWPLKNELLFRDWLIEHPEAARAYAVLKARLAVRFGDDMRGYTEGKSAFIRDTVSAARAARGLPPETDWTE